MQKVIYTEKFRCELCLKEIVMPVYGDSIANFTSEEKLECVDWCRHFHWIDFHRTCAICGEIVVSGDLDLAVNTGKIEIHSNYTDEYRIIKRGQRFGPLLIVHEKCIQTYDKQTENQ